MFTNSGSEGHIPYFRYTDLYNLLAVSCPSLNSEELSNLLVLSIVHGISQSKIKISLGTGEIFTPSLQYMNHFFT